MTLNLTIVQRERLLENGRRSAGNPHADPYPVVRIYDPDGNASWFLAEIDPQNPHIAFGLCDLGLGYPELGSVSLDELGRVKGYAGMPMEVDRNFEGKAPLSIYAKAAQRLGRNVEPEETSVTAVFREWSGWADRPADTGKGGAA